MKSETIFVVALFSLFYACNGQSNNDVENSEAFFSDTIPFQIDTNFLSKDYNKIFCNIEANGRKTKKALIDNGCRFCVLQTDYAPLLNTRYTPFDSTLWTPLEVQRKRSNGYLPENLIFKIGKTAYKVDTVDIMNHKDLSVFDDTSKKVIIGRDFFEKYIVELDFKKNVMIVSNHLPAKTKEYLSIPMEPCGGLHLTQLRSIKVDGFKLKTGEKKQTKITLDLGCPDAVYDRTFLKFVDQHFSQLDTSSMAFLIMNILGSAVDSVDFQFYQEDEKSRKKTMIPGSVHDLTLINSDILLGVNFFRRFNVIFDYKNNMLYLKRNK